MTDKGNVYYIGGKSYSTNEATRLCIDAGIMETVTLYRTENGAFFTVEENQIDKNAVKILSEDEARAFMDEHAAGIDIDAYNSIFGVPEKG